MFAFINMFKQINLNNTSNNINLVELRIQCLHRVHSHTGIHLLIM